MRQGSLKLLDKGHAAYYFENFQCSCSYLLVPAILTRIEKHFDRFRNSMSLACWS